MTRPARDFVSINADYTRRVVEDIGRLTADEAVLVEAPPGAGKSSLAVSVTSELTTHDRRLRLPIVTQTNEQADDLVASLRRKHPQIVVARLTGSSSGPSRAMVALAANGPGLVLASDHDSSDVHQAQVVVATARKWEFVRSSQQKNGSVRKYGLALIDEAYQMRSDALLGIAGLFDRLMCVGDPGQRLPVEGPGVRTVSDRDGHAQGVPPGDQPSPTADLLAPACQRGRDRLEGVLPVRWVRRRDCGGATSTGARRQHGVRGR